MTPYRLVLALTATAAAAAGLALLPATGVADTADRTPPGAGAVEEVVDRDGGPRYALPLDRERGTTGVLGPQRPA
ncbi:hypothetical protein [Kineococcus sp. SYSU DK018]|uniref:hypothetical protein n=1 Tax=Kineococcus sp. SYSU DK018 TaxID=3383139 RepID=UPI003D7CA7DC